MSITIYGASDDLIEIEGDIREEFAAHVDGNDLIALSNGCLFRVVYDLDGIWRITPSVIQQGTDYQIWQNPTNDDESSSDRLEVRGEVTWVAHATDYAS